MYTDKKVTLTQYVDLDNAADVTECSSMSKRYIEFRLLLDGLPSGESVYRGYPLINVTVATDTTKALGIWSCYSRFTVRCHLLPKTNASSKNRGLLVFERKDCAFLFSQNQPNITFKNVLEEFHSKHMTSMIIDPMRHFVCGSNNENNPEMPFVMPSDHSNKLLVQVDIFPDCPTASKWNSREETGHVGLVSLGSTSYLNCVLQVLFNIGSFKSCILNRLFSNQTFFTTFNHNSADIFDFINNQPVVKKGNKTCTKPTFLSALKILFYNMENVSGPVSPALLCDCLDWTYSMYHSGSHDLYKLYKFIILKIENCLKNDLICFCNESDRNIVENLFFGETTSKVDCDIKKRFADVSVNIENSINLIEALKRHFSSQYISVLPKILTVHLQRFKNVNDPKNISKIDSYFEFDEYLNLNSYARSSNVCCNYKLFAVLAHVGGVSNGHYVAFINRFERSNHSTNWSNHSTNNSSWLKFDDETITCAFKEEVLNDNFGRDASVQSRPIINTAYMLLYVRMDTINSIFRDDEKNVNEKILKNLKKLNEMQRFLEVAPVPLSQQHYHHDANGKFVKLDKSKFVQAEFFNYKSVDKTAKIVFKVYSQDNVAANYNTGWIDQYCCSNYATVRVESTESVKNFKRKIENIFGYRKNTHKLFLMKRPYSHKKSFINESYVAFFDETKYEFVGDLLKKTQYIACLPTPSKEITIGAVFKFFSNTNQFVFVDYGYVDKSNKIFSFRELTNWNEIMKKLLNIMSLNNLASVGFFVQSPDGELFEIPKSNMQNWTNAFFSANPVLIIVTEKAKHLKSFYKNLKNRILNYNFFHGEKTREFVLFPRYEVCLENSIFGQFARLVGPVTVTVFAGIKLISQLQKELAKRIEQKFGTDQIMSKRHKKIAFFFNAEFDCFKKEKIFNVCESPKYQLVATSQELNNSTLVNPDNFYALDKHETVFLSYSVISHNLKTIVNCSVKLFEVNFLSDRNNGQLHYDIIGNNTHSVVLFRLPVCINSSDFQTENLNFLLNLFVQQNASVLQLDENSSLHMFELLDGRIGPEVPKSYALTKIGMPALQSNCRVQIMSSISQQETNYYISTVVDAGLSFTKDPILVKINITNEKDIKETFESVFGKVDSGYKVKDNFIQVLSPRQLHLIYSDKKINFEEKLYQNFPSEIIRETQQQETNNKVILNAFIYIGK